MADVEIFGGLDQIIELMGVNLQGLTYTTRAHAYIKYSKMRIAGIVACWDTNERTNEADVLPILINPVHYIFSRSKKAFCITCTLPLTREIQSTTRSTEHPERMSETGVNFFLLLFCPKGNNTSYL